MGILDDAIRQHLDLKRRLGAADDELARLEDEAFGPPTRPGDPDFPETGNEQVVDDGEGSGADVSVPVVGDPVESPSAQVEEAVVEQPELGDAPELGEDQRPETGEAAMPPETGEHPDSAAAVPPQTGEDPDTGEALPAETGEHAYEPPIESLDTVEHPFEGAVEDTGEAEVVEGELEEPPPPTGEATDEDEDVLEETPEFLRDQPEDDELWFEQGEPKDFDF